MQSHIANENPKRPKSSTRYPKKLPTYVVAFGTHETYDNLMTAQQMTCNKLSPQGSINSITPTNSLKHLECATVVKLNHIIDIPEDIDVTKIEVTDGNQYGDVEKPPETEKYFIVDTKSVNIINDQPEVIFNAAKFNKKCKEMRSNFLRKNPKNIKLLSKFMNVNFKCKNSKNIMTRKLKRNYKIAKQKSINPGQIHKSLCSNLSNVVSRSRVLKKVLAKENLLEVCTSFLDEIKLNNEHGCLTSSPSTTRNTFSSNSSNNTLVHKESSSSSRNEDFISINTVNSVIQVSPNKVIPYKSNVVNFAVALAYKSSKVNNTTKTTLNKETFVFKGNPASTETIVLPFITLTSKTATDNTDTNNSKEDYLRTTKLNINYASDETLIDTDKNSSFNIYSDDDSFFIAKTSSDFKKCCENSEFTLTASSKTIVGSHNLLPTPENIAKDKENYNSTKLLDTFVNLGIFPEMAPSTSSASNYNEDINDVLITNETKTYCLNPKGDDYQVNIGKEVSKNILIKPLEIEKSVAEHRTINLPNEGKIKAKLKVNEKSQRKTCSEEFRNYNPTNLPEMWDRLILVLDLAVKRLEETLAEKILREIKKSLAVFEQYARSMPKMEIPGLDLPYTVEVKTENVLSNKEVFVVRDRINIESDACMQCDLVENKIIDQLMMSSSVENPKTIRTSTKSDEKCKTKILRDYLEVLKPPKVESTVELVKANTVTVCTATPELSEDIHRFLRLKNLFTPPVNFIRENVFVVASVPTFFALMLCIYGIIVFLMKPW